MDYDSKFEEMKKYIPFLEGMIKKLSHQSGINPRQAQRDKIKSLRDLLMDKKKRMKMENLLKCEQVLINLYAKVEQRDTLPGIIPGPNASRPPPAPEPPVISELDVVRTRLKSVAMTDETLPEIARRSETEETCTAGSKEPALFQRRQAVNRSPLRDSRTSIEKTEKPKRNYTRVLVSPEPDMHWKPESSDRPLYSRRSPRPSPVRSPQKDKGKFSKQGKVKGKNLNITLNVPDDTLDNISSEDIVSRIINCSDNDVDIDTLRDLRKQILGELKHTGANEDISDFILKSYKKKHSKRSKKEVEEGEISDSESEAIDKIYGSLTVVDKDKRTSNQGKVSERDEKQPRKIQISLVINNPELESLKSTQKYVSTNDTADFEMLDDAQISTSDKQKEVSARSDAATSKPTAVPNKESKAIESASNSTLHKKVEIISIDDDENTDSISTKPKETQEKNKTDPKPKETQEKSKSDIEKSDDDVSFVGCSTVDANFLLTKSRPNKSFKPNFYNEQESTADIQKNPELDSSKSKTTDTETAKENTTNKESPKTKRKTDEISTVKLPSKSTDKTKPTGDATKLSVFKTVNKEKDKKPTEAKADTKQTDETKPSDSKTNKEIDKTKSSESKTVRKQTEKNKPADAKTVSEIDILQALKNDILSETIAIPGAEPTPALHQPKISKVVNAETITKKTISIEKYKQKSAPGKVTPLFQKGPKRVLTSDEQARKPRLKLTEKECERFHVHSKLALDDSDPEDNVSPATLDEIYGDLGPVSPEDDLAPKSPEEVPSSHSPAPIIIPSEPVNAQSVVSNSDVDMRILSPPNVAPVLVGGPSRFRRDLQSGNSKMPPTRPSDTPKIPLLGDPPKVPLLADPRVRRDISRPHFQNSPNPYAHPERTPRHGNYPNMTPNRTPNISTPPSFDEGPGNRPNMTPSRVLSTPSYTPFDNEEDRPARKHVYAPIGNYDREQSVNREHPRDNPRWEPNDSRSDHRRPRWDHPEGRFDDQHARSTSVHRDVGPDQRSRYGPDAYDPRNDRYHRDKRDRIDCPRTPVHPFGRGDPAPIDCPRTPVHSFGRSDAPAPLYGRRDSQRPPFGRHVTNSNHPFGQSEAPLTPGPSFGRSDALLTPGPSFGRGDAPLTPGPSFGRSDAPLTPGPSFGRSDGSSTPSHSFSRGEYSRSDMPMTPIHHFGRSDASMTPGRYEQSSHNYVKDPRLNRSSEYDGRRFDRNADRFDRQSEGRPHQNYGRERSVGRNERPYDQNDSSYREQSIGRGMSRQVDYDPSYDRNRRAPSAKRSFGPNDDIESRDFLNRRDFVRGQSVGRSDNRGERGLSVGRDYKNTNTLSVEAQSGRSFIIDTSVNSTFQQFLNEKGLKEFGFSSYDDRRKRASSVGRFLSTDISDTQRQDSVRPPRRESTFVDRDMYSKPHTSTDDQDTSRYKDMVNFVRARSMGRDLMPVTTGKSFAEVKDDLKSFSAKSKPRKPVQSVERKMNDRDPRSKKNSKLPPIENKYPIKKSSYSPRKNNRDPRMHREDGFDGNKHDNRQKSHGIVYSNDNIARGSLLNPSSGVKNYKIPKIKKPEPEVPPAKEDTPEKSKEFVKGKNKAFDRTDKKLTNKKMAAEKNDKKVSSEKIDKKVSAEKIAANKIEVYKANTNKISVVLERAKLSKTIETKEKATREENSLQEYDEEKETSRRMTRATSRKRSVSISENTKKFDDDIPIQRKPKRAVIESDSEETDEINKPSQSKVERIKKAEECDKLRTITKVAHVQKTSKDVSNENDDDDLFDGSFTIDDLDISSDPITNEKSLIENINSLIDDLDNDLNGKNETTKDIESDSNLLEGCVSVSPEPDITIKDANVDVLNDISEVISKDLTETTSSDPADVLNTNIQPVPEKIAVPQKTAAQEKIAVPQKTAVSQNTAAPEKIAVPEKTAAPEKITVPQKTPEKNVLITTDEEKRLLASSPIHPSRANSNNKQYKDIGVKVPEVVKINQVDTTKRQDIVTTTDSENDSPALDEKLELSPDKLELSQPTDDKERCSTPDSTINTANPEVVEPKSKDVLHPDIISETSNEMNPQVTSTHHHQEGPKTSDSETSRSTTQIESIGNLLSILQDKSKIKELLSMLDQSSETEKIKKKLEKLSEIVDESDEDENKNDHVTEKDDTEKRAPVSDEPEVKSESDAKSALFAKSESELKSDDTSEKAPEKTTGKTDTELEDSKVEHSEGNDDSSSILSPTQPPTKVVKKIVKRGKGGKSKKVNKKVFPNKAKRVTRSGAAKPKASRELKQLQEDIKEMFIKDDIMNATGIRVCRLAKLVDEKRSEKDDDSDTSPNEKSPVVVLQKYSDEPAKDTPPPLKVRKKPGPKPKPKVTETSQDQGKKAKKAKIGPRNMPGPKPKQKITEEESDPYAFETDSVSDVTTLKSFDSSTIQESSDSENESLASSKSFGSSEVILAELKKKPKRKRGRRWQSGIIAKRKKKNDIKVTDRPETPTEKEPSDAASSEKDSRSKVAIPDTNCFIDPTYCFRKNRTSYSCRLCEHTSSEIVHHYKKQHPHSEIPLSRLSPKAASNAIEQSAYVDFQAISRVPSDRYVCRFCFKEFVNKKSTTALEIFFWHVVSTHTGEYKQLCPECINVTRCPFNLDIPAPPKEVKGQLIGYICEKCNFTQISLENLKTHVTVRHNDEQTSVCTINLAIMTAKTLQKLTQKSQYLKEDTPRTLRSSNQSSIAISDTDISESTGHTSDKDSTKQEAMPESFLKNRVAKLTFEDESDTENENASSVKTEREDEAVDDENRARNDDMCDYPHFKVWFSESGTKEYVCCVNGQDNHYKTSLFISMKRHIQTQHNIETWDGYCFICKVIVTSQGRHTFKDCFQHCVDMHTDNLPLWDASKIQDAGKKDPTSDISKSPISVIPTKQLLQSVTPTPETAVSEECLPTIENVMSIAATDPLPKSSNTQETISNTIEERETSIDTLLPPTVKKIYAVPEEIHKYEEVQAEVMSKKHHVVLQTMMSKESLARIYKCAGRYCSFTSDAAEAAWSHASTHQRNGGENALVCSYCDFDCKGNASDLVTHVFKSHGSCQFACSMCFYRAAASRLVQSHIFRAHPQMWDQVKVLESTTPKYGSQDPVVPLSRELAVKYYTCVNDEANCKYKTFILDKFSEHMAKKSSPYVCSICNTSFATVAELTQHVKGHGLNMYQCTWCVYGAENEAELLAHASARHPARQPQAYVRTINTKDAVKQMVLPLAKFNKSNVQTALIKASAQSEDPIREAERSIDLEKLISSVECAPAVEIQQETITEIDEDNSYEVPPSPYEPEPEMILPDPPKVPTPPPAESLNSRKTPVLKTERVDDSPVREIPIVHEIINLDSDDDEPPQTPTKKVVDLSKDDTPSTSRSPRSKRVQFDKIPLASLFKCPRCYITSKTLPAFKRHINICYDTLVSKLRCAHCPYETEAKDLFFTHYTCDHGTANKELEMPLLNKRETRESRRSNEAAQLTPIVKVYICGICEVRDPLLSVIGNHMRTEHGLRNLNVSQSFGKNNKDFEYTVLEAPAPTKAPTKKPSTHKRKLSAGNAEPQQKRIRYSLQDLDKLPVKPILDDLAFCAECEFNTKVRLNLVRHLQQHADNRHIVPSTVPLNPVPHLETNEKHFDKMVNLASSSSETSRLEKLTPRKENAEFIPPETTARYPKFVPDRQRHTCGAKGCSYISVDQAMLKRHWEALHDGSNDYHCVHCPPYQQLDTATPLTAARIISHLKMHDINMYACSTCPYYHHKRNILEKHLDEVHKGSGKLLIVREENSSAPAAVPSISQAHAFGPTMDLKPWQCGLCKYKSLLRPEVIEHCCKIHNIRMQFKCPNCPFRASTFENVSKHKTNSHPESTEDVFYYYYREGSIPDEPDGMPRWQKQRQKTGNPEPEVKVEEHTITEPLAPLGAISAPPIVDLNKVKQEKPDPEIELTVEELYLKYGTLCEPTGLKYKCPLCKVFVEDSKDVMQSHLFEELQYRKWGCSVCSYKAFHKKGLTYHMFLEHHQRTTAPVVLPVDKNLEKWVAKLLDTQTKTIEIQKDAISKQIPQNATPASSSILKIALLDVNEEQMKNLEQAFGQLGTSKDCFFCCPKCDFRSKDEDAFKDHLEIELNKIRWRCSRCPNASQNYHEAQRHSKTCNYGGAGVPARPVEAIRDPALRCTWVNTAIRLQKKTMNIPEDQQMVPDDMTTAPAHLDLLVVRYEERVPTPEEEMLKKKRAVTPLPSTSAEPDPESDDERLVIDDAKPQEPRSSAVDVNIVNPHRCPYCVFSSKYAQALRIHTLRHYNLRPSTCNYCSVTCDMKTKSKIKHTETAHPGMAVSFRNTPIPKKPPSSVRLLSKTPGRKRSASVLDTEEKTDKPDEELKDICLVCEKYVAESEKQSHPHNSYAVKGQVLVKCCTCLSLFVDLAAMQEHQVARHPADTLNYAYFKLRHDTREILVCAHCNKTFKFKRDLKAHNDVVHGGLPLKYETKTYSHAPNEVLDISDDSQDKLTPTENKRASKKSTTKLPSYIAKKSTSKLPFFALNEDSSDSDCVEEEYLTYKPAAIDKLENVKTIIPD